MTTIHEHLKTHFEEAISPKENHSGPAFKVTKERLKEVLRFLKERMGFTVLMDLSAVDYIAPEKKTEVIYFLHNPSTYERVLVSVYVEREEYLPSMIDLWKGANWYERELYDLFGVHFTNHPDLTRILMPDDWEGHPLRKDYALTEVPVEFKHGVKPKVPSQIIQIRKEQKYKQ